MTILVAVAEDGLLEEVLDTAIRLGEGLEQSLYVVYLTSNRTADADERRFRKDVRQYIPEEVVDVETAIEYLDREGVRPENTVGKQLAELTSDTRITHAVVGHSSKTVLKRVTRGDVAFTLADTAEVPVTVVPDELS